MPRQVIQRVGTRDVLDFRVCDSCGARARLIGLEPDPHGSGAMLCTFECQDCGDLQTELTARPMSEDGKLSRLELAMPRAINRVLPGPTSPEFPICRACGDQMLLARVTPHGSDRKACVQTFECRCGYRIQRTATPLTPSA